MTSRFQPIEPNQTHYNLPWLVTTMVFMAPRSIPHISGADDAILQLLERTFAAPATRRRFAVLLVTRTLTETYLTTNATIDDSKQPNGEIIGVRPSVCPGEGSRGRAKESSSTE